MIAAVFSVWTRTINETGRPFFIRWFRTSGRSLAETEYIPVITGYAELNGLAQTTMRECFDELFTEEECAALRAFLDGRVPGEFVAHRETLPLRFTDDGDNGRVTQSYQHVFATRTGRSPARWIDLTTMPDYDLPFAVQGCFNAVESGDSFAEGALR